jgi:hypothetical protein
MRTLKRTFRNLRIIWYLKRPRPMRMWFKPETPMRELSEDEKARYSQIIAEVREIWSK